MRNLSDKRPPIVLHDDEIFAAHVGGKLSVALSATLDTQRLSVAYTPGVAQVSRAIAADHTLAARYTWANRMVAVVIGAAEVPDRDITALRLVVSGACATGVVPRRSSRRWPPPALARAVAAASEA